MTVEQTCRLGFEVHPCSHPVAKWHPSKEKSLNAQLDYMWIKCETVNAEERLDWAGRLLKLSCHSIPTQRTAEMLIMKAVLRTYRKSPIYLLNEEIHL